MKFISKSLFAFALLLMQLPVFADIGALAMETHRRNPLDKKTEFINNQMIAFSEVKDAEGSRKFVAVIPFIGSNSIAVYEVNPYTSALKKSVTLEGHLYSPFYITFDPTGLHLYALSSTKNIITQYTFNEKSGKYELVKRNNSSMAKDTDLRTVCDDNYFFSFDYARTLNIFRTEHKAYLTCQDKKNYFSITQYHFDDKTGELIKPNSLFDKKIPRKELVNPGMVLIGPFGKFVYVVDGKNTWHKYELENGYFKESSSFTTDASKTVSATFDPAGKNVYAVAYDKQGHSVIVQYRFDAASGFLSKVDTTGVVAPSKRIEAQAVYLQFGPKGHYAYAFDRNSNVIYQYRVDAETGKLQALDPALVVTCSVIRSLVFDPNPATPHAYAAASNLAHLNLKPQNPKLCQPMMDNPFELHVDQFLMDPKTGQLSSFMSKS